ncbi:MAG TPA: peroxiredoxin [Thermoplasmata archaeon]
MADLLEPGTEAPDFEGVTQDGREIRLRDFEGRPVVLYFYPEDDTPGCTREACAFRDDLGALKDFRAEVLGVSVQDAASHRAFRERYGLNFDLVADPDKRIARSYNALGLFGVAKRVTYVIGPTRKILAAYRRIDPGSHSREALRVLSEAVGK